MEIKNKWNIVNKLCPISWVNLTIHTLYIIPLILAPIVCVYLYYELWVNVLSSHFDFPGHISCRMNIRMENSRDRFRH